MTPAFSHEKNIFTGILFVFLLALSFLLHVQSLNADFVIDAQPLVVHNPVIKYPWLYEKIFSQDYFYPMNDDVHGKVKLNYYRPVPLASLAVDYAIWKLRPYGYRLSNIFIHALNSLFVYIFLLKLFKKKDIALLSSLLFCILPVHQWVVNYISGRTDLLQATFSLLSLWCFLKYLDDKKRKHLALSFLSYAVAVLSRELAVIQPFLIALSCYTYTHDKRRALRFLFIFSCVSAAYLCIRMFFLPLLPRASIIRISSFRGFIDLFIIHARVYMLLLTGYCLRFILPWGAQSLILGPFKTDPMKLLVAGSLLTVFVAYLIREKSHKKQIYSFGLFWIALNFIPLFFMLRQFERLGPVLAEHYLYMSSVGFVVILACFLAGLPEKAKKGLIVTVFLFYCAVTAYNNFSWRTESSLISFTQALFPEGRGIFHEGKAKEFGVWDTLENYAQGQDENKEKSFWLSEWGNEYLKNEENEPAKEKFEEALKLDQKNAVALRGLGVIDYRAKRLRDAREKLKASLAINPDDMDALLYAAMVHLYLNENAEFETFLKKAIALSKYSTYPYRLVAAEFYRHGFLQDAFLLLKETIATYPDDIDAMILLSRMSFNIGRIKTAYLFLKRAQNIYPGNREIKELLLRVEEEKNRREGFSGMNPPQPSLRP